MALPDERQLLKVSLVWRGAPEKRPHHHILQAPLLPVSPYYLVLVECGLVVLYDVCVWLT